jgi:hypothetical protein
MYLAAHNRFLFCPSCSNRVLKKNRSKWWYCGSFASIRKGIKPDCTISGKLETVIGDGHHIFGDCGMSGSLQLSEYRGELVRLACEKCGRSGQYRKQTLIERFGADIRLPDLREEIAQCERHGKMHAARGPAAGILD